MFLYAPLTLIDHPFSPFVTLGAAESCLSRQYGNARRTLPLLCGDLYPYLCGVTISWEDKMKL